MIVSSCKIRRVEKFRFDCLIVRTQGQKERMSFGSMASGNSIAMDRFLGADHALCVHKFRKWVHKFEETDSTMDRPNDQGQELKKTESACLLESCLFFRKLVR